MEIKNLKEAALRIKQAVSNNENILLYSDADLDGVASLIILEESIKNLGGNIVSRYFPEREQEGYGLSEQALDFFKHFSPGLLILSDCGIGNIETTKMANKLGFEVIILDHHEMLPQVPQALIIVDPKQQQEEMPEKSLAACGICLKLAELLLADCQNENILQGFYELAALGTLADMMPLNEVNQAIVEKGMDTLENSQRIGLYIFREFFDPMMVAGRDLANKMISILQLTDSINHFTESYIFLSCGDLKEAKIFLQNLIEKNQQRKQLLEALEKEIGDRVKEESLFIFEGGKDIPQLLSGSLASRICNKFKKPAFIFAEKNGISRGSVRTIAGVNAVKAMEGCSDYLINYGGHQQAAGFGVKNENLKKFKSCLEKYFKEKN